MEPMGPEVEEEYPIRSPEQARVSCVLCYIYSKYQLFIGIKTLKD